MVGQVLDYPSAECRQAFGPGKLHDASAKAGVGHLDAGVIRKAVRARAERLAAKKWMAFVALAAGLLMVGPAATVLKSKAADRLLMVEADQPTTPPTGQDKQAPPKAADPKKPGPTEKEPGKQDKTQRDKRKVRWQIIFSTGAGAGNDYLKQLDDLGALLAFEKGDDKYMVIRNLKEKLVRPVQEDIRKFDMIWWVDDKPQSVAALASALGIRPVPELFLAFFPAALEREMLDKELKAFQGKEEDIEETEFRVVLREGRYRPEVASQKRKKR